MVTVAKAEVAVKNVVVKSVAVKAVKKDDRRRIPSQ
jgi:hypothetical protein